MQFVCWGISHLVLCRFVGIDYKDAITQYAYGLYAQYLFERFNAKSWLEIYSMTYCRSSIVRVLTPPCASAQRALLRTISAVMSTILTLAGVDD
jgi:hypothetical protein